MYCTEVLVTLLGLFGALIVIWRPGNRAPCRPSLRPWLLRAATCLNKSWYTALTKEYGNPGLRRGKIFSSPEFLRHFEETGIGEFLQGDGSVSETFPEISGSFSWIFYILSEPQLTSYAYRIFAVQNWWNYSAFCSHLATRQPTVTGGCVVLNLLLQLETHRQLTLAMKRQIWHG